VRKPQGGVIRGRVSSSHEITWRDSSNSSAFFDLQAVAVGIRGAVGAVGVTGAVESKLVYLVCLRCERFQEPFLAPRQACALLQD
jgi:hypothetical protein